MTRTVSPGEASRSGRWDVAVGSATEVLRDGGIVLLPTDTVYGLAVSAWFPGAVARLFALKRRDRSNAVAVLVDGIEMAGGLGDFDDRASRLARRHWPGALTLVVPRAPRARGLFLGGDPTTVGLRWPDHELIRRVCGACGPLATTSANLSGVTVGPVVEDALVDLDGPGIDLVVDAGPLAVVASTVVSLVGRPTLLRPGAVPADMIDLDA